MRSHAVPLTFAAPTRPGAHRSRPAPRRAACTQDPVGQRQPVVVIRDRPDDRLVNRPAHLHPGDVHPPVQQAQEVRLDEDLRLLQAARAAEERGRIARRQLHPLLREDQAGVAEVEAVRQGEAGHVDPVRHGPACAASPDFSGPLPGRPDAKPPHRQVAEPSWARPDRSGCLRGSGDESARHYLSGAPAVLAPEEDALRRAVERTAASGAAQGKYHRRQHTLHRVSAK